ncbi:hypothetical protein R6Z02_01375 [Carnobacterium maltaromaticum]|uniref:phage tail terminator family protein n=1 Tax=Carnobacterium TaxID=2747 RepID=UPI00191BB5D4|nr:hypothetical protein [Carnobacterium maltaromaticum]MDW5522385.1 hypothetical protein [Carnobacterium maltaromaticum]CAD5898104.1 hypothetical protein CMALT430_180017 [Carnobacterium maltaromaticum]CAD5900553.1 hypothetical protein CMALT394_300027 [Carnobacterium maltaromaticum]
MFELGIRVAETLLDAFPNIPIVKGKPNPEISSHYFLLNLKNGLTSQEFAKRIATNYQFTIVYYPNNQITPQESCEEMANQLDVKLLNLKENFASAKTLSYEIKDEVLYFQVTYQKNRILQKDEILMDHLQVKEATIKNGN